MSKGGFSLGDYIKNPAVFKTDTVREQIEYIPLENIDPDPGNFYSLDGLDELAANIELVGLQQPLRVRPTSSVGSADSFPKGEAKAMRYIVVSGHRRRAACLLIRDGGSDMFASGVPCIVERGDVSREMQELRLIYANASTRVMTSAELSRQAERVTELLYQLKEQGVEFPGRMRDHVAEAVNASKTKIARLHAIRERLVPELLAEFDAGRINESVAYRISQEDSAVQAELAKAPAIVRGETAEKIGQIIDRLKAPPQSAEADGGPMRASASTEDEDEDEDYDEDEGPAVSILDLVPRWQTGTPAREGRYLCRLDLGLNKPTEQRCDFRDGAWTAYGRPVSDVGKVVGWWPLPEEG